MERGLQVVKDASSVLDPGAPPADEPAADQPDRSAVPYTDSAPRRVFEEDAGPRVADALLGFLGALIVLSWVVVAVAHAGDLFGLNHVAGSRMDLAQYASRHLAIYPPLFDGHHLGGTRYMPIPLMLHAGLSFLTGDLVTSGKLLSYVAMAATVALTYVALTRARAPRGWSMALAAVVLVTQSGFAVGTGINADGVPVALQLTAVLVATSKLRRRIPLAAALCVLAVFSKQSALWAPAAICAWLWMQDRRSLWRFAAMYAGGVAVAFAAFLLLTHGRFLSVLSLTLSGESGFGSALRRPGTLLYWFPIRAAPAALLLPFAVVAVARGVRSRKPSPWQLSLLFATAILFVIWTDAGTEFNHLVDLIVLISIVAGEGWARDASTRKRADRTVTAVLMVAVAWALLFSNDQMMAKAVRNAIASPASVREDQWSVQSLRRYVAPRSRLLSEDPTVPLMLGKVPVVEDAFMVPRIGKSHPEYVRWLVQRVNGKDFDEVLLLKRIGPTSLFWYRSLDFGPDVVRAIETNYHFKARVGAYFMYVPRR